MKIKIVSDLHLEFGNIDIPFDGEDYLILAGDIQVGMSRLKWFQELLKYRSVIYVMGNHEYYFNDYLTMKKELKDFQEQVENIPERTKFFRCLQNNVIYLGNKDDKPELRVLGCTLWTKLEGVTAILAEQEMNDYRIINKGITDILTAKDTNEEHIVSEAWLTKELNNKKPYPTLVVTHHTPSSKSVHKKYNGHPLNLCYYSPLDHLVELADIWVHGHTHTSFDYKLGKCRVICNPRGYKNYEENPEFNPNLVIEV